MEKYHCCCNSPFGFIRIEGTEKSILSVSRINLPDNYCQGALPNSIKKCCFQLSEYFNKKRKVFDIDIIFEGTKFQKDVWKAIMNIPYGKTASYKDIAITIGKPNSFHAVGNAASSNKLWLLVPCHRVINSNGAYGGYGGNAWLKKSLIEFEKNNS